MRNEWTTLRANSQVTSSVQLLLCIVKLTFTFILTPSCCPNNSHAKAATDEQANASWLSAKKQTLSSWLHFVTLSSMRNAILHPHWCVLLFLRVDWTAAQAQFHEHRSWSLVISRQWSVTSDVSCGQFQSSVCLCWWNWRRSKSVHTAQGIKAGEECCGLMYSALTSTASMCSHDSSTDDWGAFS